MKILLLNNTAGYHSGSRQVMRWFHEHLIDHDVHVFDKGDMIDYASLDLVIFNGEGTTHDNGKKMRSCLNIMQRACDAGVRTVLANALWQNNNDDITESLAHLDRVLVRECRSKNAITQVIDRDVEVFPDVSLFLPVEPEHMPRVGVVAGNTFDPDNRSLITGIGEDATIDIFTQTWEHMVNQLRQARVLVTARQHEMYAALVARCPFVVLESETHKNGGFLDTWAPDIAALDRHADSDDIKRAVEWTLDNIHLFDQLWHRLDELQPPNLLN